MRMAPQNMNAVFYATSYHPIQAGSIDGTDTVSHDNGVYRALVASSTGLYDPTADPKATGEPYNTLFIGRLASHTTEKTLHEAMSRYGTVKQLRLVRDFVTGASRRYAFLEFESVDDMHNAYEVAQHHIIDGSPIIVDYNRQQLMNGWIPRRLGGGLGGRKESGQLRFGGRDRPFRAPLRPIPEEQLIKLGIPLPPVGQYMSRFQVPPIPQRPGHLQSSYSKQRRYKRSPPNDALRFERQGDNNEKVVGLDRQSNDSYSVGKRYAELSQRFPEGDSQVKHRQSISNVESEELWESEPRKHHKKRSHSERVRADPSDLSEREYQKQYFKKRSHSGLVYEERERYQYPMSPSCSQERAGNASHYDRSSYRESRGHGTEDGNLGYEKSSRLSHERRASSKSRHD